MEPGSGVKFQTKKHPRAKVADSENLENGTGTVPIVDLQKNLSRHPQSVWNFVPS
jgi:hypothetical protein